MGILGTQSNSNTNKNMESYFESFYLVKEYLDYDTWDIDKRYFHTWCTKANRLIYIYAKKFVPLTNPENQQYVMFTKKN